MPFGPEFRTIRQVAARIARHRLDRRRQKGVDGFGAASDECEFGRYEDEGHLGAEEAVCVANLCTAFLNLRSTEDANAIAAAFWGPLPKVTSPPVGKLAAYFNYNLLSAAAYLNEIDFVRDLVA